MILGYRFYVFVMLLRLYDPGSEDEQTEVPKAGISADSQTTVPATSPQVKESMQSAKEMHDETLRKMEAEASAKAGTEGTPQTRRVSSEPLLTHKKCGKFIKGRGVKTAATKARAKGKGPSVKNTAVKSAPKPKAKKETPRDVNPFELPPDPNQTKIQFPRAASAPQDANQPGAPVSAPETKKPDAKQPVAPVSAPETKKPDAPVSAPVTGHNAPKRTTTMEDMTAMLNRGNTHDLDTVAEPSPSTEPSLTDMGELLDSEIEKKGRRPKTQQEKERHARRMRFFRSLTSPFLSWGACFSGWVHAYIYINTYTSFIYK